MFSQLVRPRSIGVEVGVWKGHFSRIIKHTVAPRRLYLVDIWLRQDDQIDKNPVFHNTEEAEDFYVGMMRRFRGGVEAGTIVMIRADSLVASRFFADRSLDWVYIDANHRYESVKAELHAYLPKLKIGGLLLGHDYFDVPNYIDVQRAVDEFYGCRKGEVEWLGQSIEKNPSFAMRRIT